MWNVNLNGSVVITLLQEWYLNLKNRYKELQNFKIIKKLLQNHLKLPLTCAIEFPFFDFLLTLSALTFCALVKPHTDRALTKKWISLSSFECTRQFMSVNNVQFFMLFGMTPLSHSIVEHATCNSFFIKK